MNLEKIMPHKKPAVLLTRLDHMNEQSCKVFMDSPELPTSPFLLIEAAAQAVAAMLGKSNSDQKKAPTEGYLVGVRNMQFLAELNQQAEICVQVQQARNLDPFFQYHAELFQADCKVAQGTITLFKREQT